MYSYIYVNYYGGIDLKLCLDAHVLSQCHYLCIVTHTYACTNTLTH